MDEPVAAVVSSPQRRASETAEVIASLLELPFEFDERLRERMNLEAGGRYASRQAFLADWERTTLDRDFVPLGGDSSRAAGERFAAAVADLCARRSGQRVVVVSHGGVTLDFLRDVCGDEALAESKPGILVAGLPDVPSRGLSGASAHGRYGRWLR